MSDIIREINGPPVRLVLTSSADDVICPDDRISCANCARVVTKVKTPERCVPGMKWPADHRHRCWYFKAQPMAVDRRPGHVRYATDDPELRRALGFKPEGS